MPKRRGDEGDSVGDDERRGRATRGVHAYAKYSGLAFQMIVPIVVGAYGGRWLDDFRGSEGNTWLIVGSLLGIALALYLPLRSVLADDREEREARGRNAPPR